ncbi:site-specific DNA-methyltransferase, partial [Christensenellaceae bacterium OttesenSCG-928-K19]|nr:site-specific DNA-methyltransferase [Christensenellaceae bacterium OttesenSCG-928-K19]
IVNPNTGEEHYPPQNGNWRFNKETIDQLLENDEIFFGEDGKGRPKLKRFLANVKDGITYTTIWDFVPFNTQGSSEMTELLGNIAVFDNPKPSGLIKELCKLGSDKDSLILDFFSGSATTAHAVMQLNAEDQGKRRFIMIQLPEATDENSEAYKAGYKNICEIGKERIRRAGAKIKEEAGLLANDMDTGFRVFKLDSSNLKQWDDSYVDEDHQGTVFDRMASMFEPAKPGRTDKDILFEIYLKYGIELTEPFAKLDVDGKTFYAVGENGYLFICLDKDITVEVVEQAVTYTPGTMIFARDSFADSNAITNTVQVLEKHEIEFRWI